PVGHRSRLLLAEADPTVSDGGWRGSEFPRKALDRLGLDPGDGCGALRRPLARQLLYSLEALGYRFELAEVGEALGEDHMQHPQQQECIPARSDLQVLRCQSGRLR